MPVLTSAQGFHNFHWMRKVEGKYTFCVLPRGTCVFPEIFDIKTSKNIRNETGVYKNADDIMGGGQKLEELDVRMRKVFQVCRERGIKLNPNKLQCGRMVKFGGMIIEAVESAGEAEENTVYISPEQRKIYDFLNIETPSSKRECQMICGTASWKAVNLPRNDGS